MEHFGLLYLSKTIDKEYIPCILGIYYRIGLRVIEYK